MWYQKTFANVIHIHVFWFSKRVFKFHSICPWLFCVISMEYDSLEKMKMIPWPCITHTFLCQRSLLVNKDFQTWRLIECHIPYMRQKTHMLDSRIVKNSFKPEIRLAGRTAASQSDAMLEKSCEMLVVLVLAWVSLRNQSLRKQSFNVILNGRKLYMQQKLEA